jgi:hypothetical protein
LIISAVEVDSAEQVTKLIQDMDAIVWHWHSLNWLLHQASTQTKKAAADQPIVPDRDPKDLIVFRRLAGNRVRKTTCSRRNCAPMSCLSQAFEVSKPTLVSHRIIDGRKRWCECKPCFRNPHLEWKEVFEQSGFSERVIMKKPANTSDSQTVAPGASDTFEARWRARVEQYWR